MDYQEKGKVVDNVIDFRPYILRRYGIVNKKVLIIDDEEDFVLYLATLLDNHGFFAYGAFSAEEALRQIEVDPPDLILLDIMMPGRGGLNLFSYLRKDKAFRHIPIIMVTGITSKIGGDFRSFVDNLKARVPDGYLEKPIDPDLFMQTIYKVLGNRTSQ